MTNAPRPTPEFWRAMLAFGQGPESQHLPAEERASIVSTARVSLGDYSGAEGAKLAAVMVAALAELEATPDLPASVAAVRDGAQQRLVENGALLAEEPTRG